MIADVVVPGAVPRERLLKFDHGGLGPSVVGVLGEWLKGCFNDGILVVELPLWRPDDRASGGDQFETFVVEGDVYAVCAIGDAPNKLDATIRSADPAYMYHAMIFPGELHQELSKQSGSWRERLADSVIAILVGAYDGEGFALCRRAELVNR